MGIQTDGIYHASLQPSANTPLVSLVIPVFNAEEYLQECLRSIAAQTFADFETIVVDDGSTDSSKEIASRFCGSDPRFRLIESPHGGVSRARNTGIDISRGKYIGFVDADDCLYPHSLATLVNGLESTGAQVCVGSFRRAHRFRPIRIKKSRPIVMDYPTAMKAALYQSLILNSPCGMLMERDLLGEDLRFREGIRYEDLDAFYRFYENATLITYLPSVVYFYRQADGSFMHQWSDRRIDVLDVTDRMVDYITNHHPELTNAAKDRRFSAHFNLYLLMSRLNIDIPEVNRRCLNVIRGGRSRALRDSDVRIKNKLGALASFGGTGILKFLSTFY